MMVGNNQFLAKGMEEEEAGIYSLVKGMTRTSAMSIASTLLAQTAQ